MEWVLFFRWSFSDGEDSNSPFSEPNRVLYKCLAIVCHSDVPELLVSHIYTGTFIY